ncbi:small ribosomal subunit protein mS31 [Ostrinia nubilalis]|uniref:small ribosomal subunit protein mS31 n=1 Tax=Ostrinia nubilalis TaxID=29057 RepID=UPI0030825452
MLTRLRLGKRDFRLITRFLSDKPSDNDGKAPENKPEEQETKKISSETEKIQELLKKMLAEPKISEKEYREKFATAPEIPRWRKPKADEIEVTSEKIEESITKAAGEVAQAIGGDVKQNEAELLSKVLGKINQSSTTLSDLLIGMKVDRNTEKDDTVQKPTRGQQVRRFVERPNTNQQTKSTQRRQVADTERPHGKRSIPQPSSVNIFSGEPLGIFKAKGTNYGTKLDVWDSLKERELTLSTLQPPSNYFQKMVLWTEQGKVWKFPIDNEQGLEEEQNIHFSEHVFLDSHLEGWCPKKGPIRHFMELVCVGLSKNAFYTVQEKKDHIMWYKEYFESKKDVLTEVGAWDSKPATSEAST